MGVNNTYSSDPYTQTMTWQTNGHDPLTITMEDLATFNLQNIRLGLIYGSQIGLAVLMLVTVLLLAQPGKRRTPVYVLNVLALIFDLLRGSMMAVWLDSMWNHPYVFFAQDYSRITGEDKANSIAADVFKTLELSTVLVSLIFQVRVIMSTTTSAKRALVTSTAFVVAMVTICVQVATTAVNADNIAHPAPLADDALQLKLSDVCVILQLVSVGFFLIIFTAKLGIVIHQRYKLGYSKFGPMQIVFIGSLQSMLIPVIFTAAQWKKLVDLGSLSMTMLAIQLPLTALWASTSLEKRMNAKPQLQGQKHPIAMGSGKQSKGDRSSGKEVGKCVCSAAASASPLPFMGASVAASSAYKLEGLPTTTTIGSLDMEVKMHERDMV